MPFYKCLKPQADLTYVMDYEIPPTTKRRNADVQAFVKSEGKTMEVVLIFVFWAMAFSLILDILFGRRM